MFFFLAPPVVDMGQRNFTAEVGEEITFNCTVSSLIKVQDVWWDRPYFVNSFQHVNQLDNTEHTTYFLYIDEADVNHTGSYQCCARNEIGDSCSAATYLVVSSK